MREPSVRRDARPWRSRLVTALTLSVGVAALGAVLEASTSASPPRQYLLRVSPGELQTVLERHRLTLESLDRHLGSLFLVVDREGRQEQALQLEVGGDAAVLGFEPNRTLILPEMEPVFWHNQSSAEVLEALQDDTTSDFFGRVISSSYVEQAWADTIGVPFVHGSGYTGGVVVAVIDTGVDPKHPVLRGSLVDGYDFVRGQPGSGSEMPDLPAAAAAVLDPASGMDQSTGAILETAGNTLDQSTGAILEKVTAVTLSDLPPDQRPPAAFGHGTMVAGLVHRVAPTARIMPLKAFTGAGTASLLDVIRAVSYAVENGARVVQVSVALTVESAELKRALDAAAAHGVVCIGPAGNVAQTLVTYPARWTSALGVGATSDTDAPSTFSSRGDDSFEVGAPGEGLVTTWPAGRFAGAWGTSFSAAVAAGGAALLLNPAITSPASAQAEAAIVIDALRQAQWLGPDLGTGRIDLGGALSYRLTAPVP